MSRIRIAANLSFMFAEVPMAERFGLASLYGFDAVEIQFPYDHSAEELRALADRASVDIVLINIPAPGFIDGGEGLAAVPELTDEFLRAVETSIEYADIMCVPRINVLPGRCLDEARANEYIATYKQNLQLAADRMAEHNIRCVFEAINTTDMPGFLVHSHQQQLDILHELNHANLSAQVDIYHVARDAGPANILSALSDILPFTGHIQFADLPGRGEPGSGAIDFELILQAIHNSDYNGIVAAEYKPTINTPMTLDWLPKFRAGLGC
ncbi:MAG: TIM barrel protein [Planctomycetales bacterium]|nr:TIM barrel protein [Planctomycetales bacterium]